MPLIDYPAFKDLDAKTREILERTGNEQGQVPSFPRMLSAVAESDYAEFKDRQRSVAEFARQAATDPPGLSAVRDRQSVRAPLALQEMQP